METLGPEPIQTSNAINVEMPDGSNLIIHAPGAEDVLARPIYGATEIEAVAGPQLEPLGAGETFGGQKTEESFNQSTLPANDSDPSTDHMSMLDLDSELERMIEEEATVLASGIALRGVANWYRRGKVRRLNNKADRLDEQARQVGIDLAGEIADHMEQADRQRDLVDHRMDTSQIQVDSMAPTSPTTATGEYDPLVRFQKTHRTRKLPPGTKLSRGIDEDIRVFNPQNPDKFLDWDALLHDGEKRQSSLRSNTIRHELSEIGLEISSLVDLYGRQALDNAIIDINNGVDRRDSTAEAARKLMSLQHHSTQLRRELDQRSVGIDEDSRGNRREARRHEDAAQTSPKHEQRRKLSRKAADKRRKAADVQSRII